MTLEQDIKVLQEKFNLELIDAEVIKGIDRSKLSITVDIIPGSRGNLMYRVKFRDQKEDWCPTTDDIVYLISVAKLVHLQNILLNDGGK